MLLVLSLVNGVGETPLKPSLPFQGVSGVALDPVTLTSVMCSDFVWGIEQVRVDGIGIFKWWDYALFEFESNFESSSSEESWGTL